MLQSLSAKTYEALGKVNVAALLVPEHKII